MRKKHGFAYGTGRIELELEESLLAHPFISPRPAKGSAGDPATALASALESPVGRPRLREMVAGRKVALVVSDEFRAGLHETILDVLIGEISKGRPARLAVLCATGTHDPAIYTPNVRKWAAAASEKHGQPIDFVAHECDDERLVEVGTTRRGTRLIVEPAFLEAEVRVFGHEAKHHYMAGYSSVVKQVVPGISARRTVENNHRLALDDDSAAGRHPYHPDPAKKSNPFSDDAIESYGIGVGKSLEGGKLVDRPAQTFLLDMISDRSEVFWVKSGDPEKVTAELVVQADAQAEFVVPRARYVVVSPGGPPASQALYGVQNCFDLALMGAIQPGGEALVLGPCDGRPGVEPDVRGLAPDRKSKELFWDNLVRMQDWPLEKCHREISDHFELYLWKTWRVLRLFKRDRVRMWVHCSLPPDVLARGGFVHCADPQAWIDERIARGDGKFNAIDNGNKLCVRGK